MSDDTKRTVSGGFLVQFLPDTVTDLQKWECLRTLRIYTGVMLINAGYLEKWQSLEDRMDMSMDSGRAHNKNGTG